jgi:DNA-binding response OmpR family regulator
MRILVIEDYEPLRTSVTQGLREEGFAVDAAADGEEGWWHAREGEYDVIVLDLMLPRIDGLTLLKRLRQAGGKTHVLILTARDALEDRVAGLNMGADDYLVKPFAFDELLARVRALIRRRYDAKNPILRVGDLEIDTGAKTVRRADSPIELTAREYALLELLAMRTGQLVTRTEIWEHLYEFQSTAQSNVVDVYIGYVRRKIERPGGPRLIHTRRGQGYVLGEES